MLTKEDNDLLTQTGPGNPCGDLMRRYWQPVALSEELPPAGDAIPLQILGEDLVVFRDDENRVGLLDIHCAHRGADLSYGRCEDGGLRCIYHGWLYDIHGNCLEQPGEPPGSTFKDKVRQPAYPCQEVGGVIFAYMGSGEPPLLPAYEVLRVPEEHRWTTKYYHECNYLQGLEGNMDSIHVRFLHRFLRGDAGRNMLSQHPREMTGEGDYRDPKPNRYYGPVDVEETDFGTWYNGKPAFIFPSFCMTGGGPQTSGDGYQLYWRVPINDVSHWLFALAFKRSGPIDKRLMDQRTKEMMTSDYRFIRNKSNRYLQDRQEQRTATNTGMGSVFVVQDACVNEGAGPIQDRTKEHLGATDQAITAARKMMLRAIRDIQEGGEPPGVIRNPEVNAVDPLYLKENKAPSLIIS